MELPFYSLAKAAKVLSTELDQAFDEEDLVNLGASRTLALAIIRNKPWVEDREVMFVLPIDAAELASYSDPEKSFSTLLGYREAHQVLADVAPEMIGNGAEVWGRQNLVVTRQELERFLLEQRQKKLTVIDWPKPEVLDAKARKECDNVVSWEWWEALYILNGYTPLENGSMYVSRLFAQQYNVLWRAMEVGDVGIPTKKGALHSYVDKPSNWVEWWESIGIVVGSPTNLDLETSKISSLKATTLSTSRNSNDGLALGPKARGAIVSAAASERDKFFIREVLRVKSSKPEWNKTQIYKYLLSEARDGSQPAQRALANPSTPDSKLIKYGTFSRRFSELKIREKFSAQVAKPDWTLNPEFQ